MGIIDKVKRRLPIVGAGGNTRSSGPGPAAVPQPPYTAPEPAPERREQPVTEFIEEFVKSNTIAIFMKGSPESPMCGFSANASAILRSYGQPLAHFDVLSDPDVRQGVKEFSQWPTIPQIYIGGEFLGGSDILAQMHAAGDLKEAIDSATAQ